MERGQLFQKEYRPQFSGHETFPLRYGWLKKAFDAVRQSNKSESKRIFSRPEAIADFGVGKNMVLSIRHWANVFNVISDPESDGTIATTQFGELIFAPRGLDPFMEHPSTLWLLHWILASKPKKTTWYWIFNLYTNRKFDRAELVAQLHRIAVEQEWPRASQATIKRDVDCFIRTYVPKRITRKLGFEDSLECPLAELGLINSLGSRDGYELSFGPKPTLGMGVFLFALEEFWRNKQSSTLSLEAIAHEPGSPGRVFLLDENDLVQRFAEIEKASGDHFRWSETAGLKQVIRSGERSDEELKHEFLSLDYQIQKRAKSA